MLHAATDLDPDATILTVDELARLITLLERPCWDVWQQCQLLVESSATLSAFSWWDDDGNRRTISQTEHDEQSDPLMPLLFSIRDHWRKSPPHSGPGSNYARVVPSGTCHGDLRHVDRVSVARCRNSSPPAAKPECGTKLASHLPTSPEIWQPEGILVLGTPIGSTHCCSNDSAKVAKLLWTRWVVTGLLAGEETSHCH